MTAWPSRHVPRSLSKWEVARQDLPPPPAVTVPSAVGAALAAEVRERLEKAGYNRYRLVDRGSYDEVREWDARVRRGLNAGEVVKYVVELKVDGVAVSTRASASVAATTRLATIPRALRPASSRVVLKGRTTATHLQPLAPRICETAC